MKLFDLAIAGLRNGSAFPCPDCRRPLLTFVFTITTPPNS
jgi:hypothetical protein